MKFLLFAVSVVCAFGSSTGYLKASPRSAQRANSIVRHGHSYFIQSVSDENAYLTATQHRFRPREGVFVGRVLTMEYYGSANQIWDAITWPSTKVNQFWLYPKAGALNEITAVPLPDAVIPPKNLVELEYVNVNSTETIYRITERFQFLIRSVQLGKCAESHGLGLHISYEPCDTERVEQRWMADPYVDDAINKRQVQSGHGNVYKYCI